MERIGVTRAQRAASEADLILYVADSSAPLDDNDRAILSACAGKPLIALLNKSDLPGMTTAAELREAVRAAAGDGFAAGTDEPIAISAKTGEGLADLEERITGMFFADRIRLDEECIITSERHKQALSAAADSLARVQESIAAGMSEDFYTIDLTAAYESLGSILGEEPDEDVINAIFAEFCMGK